MAGPRIEIPVDVNVDSGIQNLGKLQAQYDKLIAKQAEAEASALQAFQKLQSAAKFPKESEATQKLVAEAQGELNIANREALQIENQLEQLRERAAVGLNKTERNLTAAQGATQLLAREMGVVLPQQVSRFLARSETIGPILEKAFSVSVLAFFGVALVDLLRNMDQVTIKIVDWDGSMKRAIETTSALNKELLTQADRAEKIRREIELVGLSGSEAGRMRLKQVQEDDAKRQKTLNDLLERRAELMRKAQETEQRVGGVTAVMVPGARGGEFVPTAAALEAAKALDDMNAQVQRAGVEAANSRLEVEKFSKELRNTVTGEINRDWAVFISNQEKMARAFDQATKDAKRFQDEVAQIQREIEVKGRLALLRGGPDIDVREGLLRNQQVAQQIIRVREENDKLAIQVAGHGKDFAKVQELRIAAIDAEIDKWRDNATIVQLLEEKKRLVIAETNLKIEHDTKQRFQRTAHAIEQMLDRVFLTTRSLGDIVRQAWTQLIAFIIKQIARMVAAWVLAHRQMQQATAASFFGLGGGARGGGILGALGLGGTILGAAAPAAAAGGTAAPGFGAGSIPDIGAAGPLPETGAVGGTASGAIQGGILARAGVKLPSLITAGTVLAGLGLTQAGINRGSLLLGGLGGAALGIGTASAIGGLLGLGSLTLLGAGVFGAIGAGIGLFLGARARGRQKRQSAAINFEFREFARKTVEEFERHKVSFDSATGGLTTGFAKTSENLSRLGVPGRRTIEELRAVYQSALERINQLQKLRDARLGFLQQLPVPSFQLGGVIRGHGGLPVLIMAHGRESVLNERATARLGEAGVRSLNEGRAAEPQIVVNIQAVDGESVERWIARNERSFVRSIRRFARDRGMRPGL